MRVVKPPKQEKVSRRDRARATRMRIIAAAYERFCSDGYAGTTMAEVAAAAGVAVQTVYFTFHTKTELLAGAYEYAVLGASDPRPPHLQPWYLAATAAGNFDDALRSIVVGSIEITRRATPLESVVRATAASDPDVEKQWQHHEQLRVDGFRGLIELLETRAPLAPGVGKDEAVQLLLLYLGPHPYRGLVLDYGWPLDKYEAWVTRSIARDIFGFQTRNN